MQPDLPIKKIIHVDMDAFYASVEQRDFPEYRGKAIAIGGSPEGRGGVVATASYEARKFGVKSAMTSKKALQLCPHLIFIKPRFAAYKEASFKIREIFSRYTDLIEPLSLDEAYLDVTHDKLQIGSALDIARQIKQAIKTELELTASAGVSTNKFVAKIASDINKPDGLTFIGPSSIETFMEKLPVEKFFGVGKVTAAKMKAQGLHNGYDLKQLSEHEMIKRFGKTGKFFFQIVRGIDHREVQPNRESKSVGAEDTFAYDLETLEEMMLQLEKIAGIVADRLQKHNLKGKTVTLKLKFSDFQQLTRCRSFTERTSSQDIIEQTAKSLINALNLEGKKVRLLGISVSNFNESASKPSVKDYQRSLFD